MRKFFGKLSTGVGVAIISLVPFLAMAQLPFQAPVPITPGPISSTQGIIDLINKVLYWVATLFWIAAAIFIFYAAFLYLTASGEQEKVTKASRQFLYAVVAIAVGLMAYGLPTLVRSFLGGQ